MCKDFVKDNKTFSGTAHDYNERVSCGICLKFDNLCYIHDQSEKCPFIYCYHGKYNFNNPESIIQELIKEFPYLERFIIHIELGRIYV